jgi:PAS domain S-box-containing protein
MNGSYDPILVALSVLIAIFASYTALDLAHSVTMSHSRARGVWLSAGALALGVGIWSMHFVGMLAFTMPGMAIAYDIPLVVLSTAVAILASALALFIVSRPAVSPSAMRYASLAMGAAIAGMHYIGMWSMRVPAAIDWNPGLVGASILIAVGASFAALLLAFRYRLDASGRARSIRIGGAVVMGFAIAGMHYTAMAAARFLPLAGGLSLDERDVLATQGLAVAVTGTTLLVLAVAVAGSTINRELARRSAAAAAESARLYLDADTARRDLNAAEGRFRAIVESAMDAVVVADTDSIVVEWNQHAETIFGWSAAAAIGNSLTELIIPPQYREPHTRGMQHYLATGEGPILNRRIEITALRRDGREFPVELAITPVRSGSQILFTAFLRDVSEQKNAEKQLRESEQRDQLIRSMELERSRLSILFEQAPAFIALLHGPDHVVELTNARFDQLAADRATVGRPIRESLPELATQGFVELLDRVYETGEAYVGQGFRLLLHRDAAEPDERYLNFVYQPFIGPDGTVSGIFVHGVDVSDLVRARQEAEALNKAKSEFLSRMSHELRTPLNAILGFGQLLEHDLDDRENRDSVDQILRAGQHLLTLIDEVLDIAQIEAGRISLSVESVSVRSVVRESVDLVRLMADKQGITLCAEDALAAEQFVRADHQRLKQVLLNLLSNAIKYNRGGGSVTLSCESGPQESVRIIVRDSGRGIAAGKMERLYTPFDRLDAEQTDVEGTGLGLALSKGLTEAMGGRLGVESVEHEGSSFWVDLPLASPPGDAPSSAVRRRTGVLKGKGERTHTVLLVEDNLANVRLIERLLKRRPQIKLITAMQGGLGFDLAREHRPDLILLDFNLPDITGDKVLRQLREDTALSHIPVIMISGDAIPSQVERLLDLGAQAYVTKPFDIHEFLRILDENLGATADEA